jgi:hypothetical protein
MAAARAVMDFEEQEHAREVERQPTGVRRREARSAFILRRSAAMLLQAHVRLYVSKTLGQLREEERVRVEEAGKKRLLNNTPAAKAVGKVTQRFISHWQAISEPYQHLPFHGLPPWTTSFLAAQQQAQENEKKIQVSLDESTLSNTLTDRLHQMTDSDEDVRDFTGSEGDDDELELKIQELSSEMQRIQTAVKRGGMWVRVSQDAYKTKRLTTLLCRWKASIWKLTHTQIRAGSEEEQRRQRIELQILQSQLQTLFLRTRSSEAASRTHFEQE